jgi:hypothetical protein
MEKNRKIPPQIRICQGRLTGKEWKNGGFNKNKQTIKMSHIQKDRLTKKTNKIEDKHMD